MSKKYIVQSNSIPLGSYVVINSEGCEDLTQHPAILDKPDRFEIFEGDIPEDKIASHLNYSPEVPEAE